MTFQGLLGCIPLNKNLTFFITLINLSVLLKIYFLARLKNFQSDGWGEYMSRQYTSFLTNNGIYHQVTCPHTLEQNGILERKHKHIMEVGLLFWLNLI
jgi:hypothetical protein